MACYEYPPARAKVDQWLDRLESYVGRQFHRFLRLALGMNIDAQDVQRRARAVRQQFNAPVR